MPKLHLWEWLVATFSTGGTIFLFVRFIAPHIGTIVRGVGVIFRALIREFGPSDPKNGNGSMRQEMYKQTAMLAHSLDNQLGQQKDLDDLKEGHANLRAEQVKLQQSQDAMHDRLDKTARQVERHVQDTIPVIRAFGRLMAERAANGADNLLEEEAKNLQAEIALNALVDRGIARSEDRDGKKRE